MFRIWNWFLFFFIVAALALPVAAQGGGPNDIEIYQSTAGGWSKKLQEMAKGTVNIPGPAQKVFLGRIPFTGADTERPDAVVQTTTPLASTLAPATTTPGQGFEGLGNGQ